MDLVLKFEFLGNVEKEEFMSIIYQEETLTLKCMYTDFLKIAFSVLVGKFSLYSKQIFYSEYATVCLVIDESI